MMNPPSTSVITPLLVPFSITVAPITGSPWASITLPVILTEFCSTSLTIGATVSDCFAAPCPNGRQDNANNIKNRSL